LKANKIITNTDKFHCIIAQIPIRLEGLQSSASTDSMLTVNSIGVVRGTNAPIYVDIEDLKGASAITSGTISATGTAGAIGSSTVLAYSKTFTISRPSLILIDATMSVNNIRTTSNTTIADGTPRMFRSYWKLSTSSERYGAATNLWTSSAMETLVLAGILNNNNNCHMVLSAGTYTLEYYVMALWSTNRTVRFDYGGDSNERISIKAIQL
jgi:hypothetical protein